jgi:hypothetical protein
MPRRQRFKLLTAKHQRGVGKAMDCRHQSQNEGKAAIPEDGRGEIAPGSLEVGGRKIIYSIIPIIRNAD